jgi:hypothetical protein
VAARSADVVSTRSSRRGGEGAPAQRTRAPSKRAAAAAAAQEGGPAAAGHAAALPLLQPQLSEGELEQLVAKLIKMRQLVARTERATALMQQQVRRPSGARLAGRLRCCLP